MSYALLLMVVAALAGIAYWVGRYRALAVVGGVRNIRKLRALPTYYGWLAALWVIVPSLLVLAVWAGFQNRIVDGVAAQHAGAAYSSLSSAEKSLFLNTVRGIAAGKVSAEDASPQVVAAAVDYRRMTSMAARLRAVVLLLIGIAALLLFYRRIHESLAARNIVEKVGVQVLMLCSVLAVLVTVGIVLSVLVESIQFFRAVSSLEFLFGTNWSPQTALRADQVASEGSFGALPLFLGTMMISGIALLISVPLGLLSAIYLAEYSSRGFRTWAKPVLEVLAGVPTVVYGFFAALTLGPALRTLGSQLGLEVASESALAAGLVMGVMIIPFVSSLADDMLTAVPQSLRDGAFALGATRSEAIKQVVLRAALPGIVGGVLLAASRAIGETMIVVMAAGLAANLTANPLEAVTTVTVQIVTLLTGDQEFDSPKTLAAFALGLVLFVVTLVLNVVALFVVRKYREQYE
jgi:phosphate transport system permease protein